jgi:hypothetical protein
MIATNPEAIEALRKLCQFPGEGISRELYRDALSALSRPEVRESVLDYNQGAQDLLTALDGPGLFPLELFKPFPVHSICAEVASAWAWHFGPDCTAGQFTLLELAKWVWLDSLGEIARHLFDPDNNDMPKWEEFAACKEY